MSRSYRRDVYDPALRLEHLPLDELLNNQNRRLDVADHALLNAFNGQLSEGSITSIGCIVDEDIDSAGEILDEGVDDGLSARWGENTAADAEDLDVMGST